MCNRRDILGLMCITMPASKYTVFVPAVEQYKWFHALDSGVSSSIIPSYFYCFLRLPAELSVFIFHIFFLSFTSDVLCIRVSGLCMRIHTSALLTRIHFLLLCLVLVFLFSPVFPFALSISSKQSLLSRGSRCSIRCLPHSVCGLVRNPMNPAECISRARPVASGHNSKPHKHSRRTLFVGPRCLACCSLMALVELNWGQIVGMASGWKRD